MKDALSEDKKQYVVELTLFMELARKSWTLLSHIFPFIHSHLLC